MSEKVEYFLVKVAQIFPLFQKVKGKSLNTTRPITSVHHRSNMAKLDVMIEKLQFDSFINEAIEHYMERNSKHFAPTENAGLTWNIYREMIDDIGEKGCPFFKEWVYVAHPICKALFLDHTENRSPDESTSNDEHFIILGVILILIDGYLDTIEVKDRLERLRDGSLHALSKIKTETIRLLAVDEESLQAEIETMVRGALKKIMILMILWMGPLIDTVPGENLEEFYALHKYIGNDMKFSR